MQYIYTMIGVSKTVPPKRQIIKDISLSFYPGAKIGLLGLNGSGKTTVLRIMAGVDTDFTGEARPAPGIKVGYLEQEPRLNSEHTVRQAVEEGVGDLLHAQALLDAVYAAYGEEDADFEKLASEQQRLESILATGDAATLELQLEIAADALRLPAWDAICGQLSGGEKRRVALCRRKRVARRPCRRNWSGHARTPRAAVPRARPACSAWKTCSRSSTSVATKPMNCSSRPASAWATR
jgi:ATPase subunit of ABC transporter with duplicated ATPase domains